MYMRETIDTGSAEAEARDRLAAIGFAEVERRMRHLEVERDEARRACAAIRGQMAEMVNALRDIVALDNGDRPSLWEFEREFDAGRAAIARHLSRNR